ncbi:MAG: succinyl-diaminopimelate desuccinylase [Alphaproteobacteria bacterium]|nr:succinyl-diaminopimelate desuccinylase [Alphaproteobacteria bacterium]
MSDVIELTQELIRCASVTPKDEGAQTLLAERLSAAGFECYHLPFGEGKELIENLFARIGTNGPHICYGGHTDVVPPGPEGEWTHGPFTPQIKDGVLYGRGASDMKGSVAAFTSAAIEYVREHGVPENGSISLLITGDEEGPAVNGTVKVLEWMKANGHIPDVALVGEPTNPDKLGQEIKIGRRGSLNGALCVTGKQGHVAYPQRADNPLPKLAKLAAILAEHEFDQGNDFFPPTNLEITSINVDNTADNVIPHQGRLRFNIRYNDLWNSETLDAKLREILDRTGLHYDLQTDESSKSFLTQPGPWTETVKGAVEEFCDGEVQYTTSGGTSDARFFPPYCPVVEFGPVNATIHQIDENAKVSDLEDLTKIYKRVIELFFEERA